MNQRDRVSKLAKTDFAAAFKLAKTIDNVRERIQALGWVARYAPADEIPRVIAAANQSAGTSSDFYQDVMSLAWPIRALHETGNATMIPPLLKVATQMVPDVAPVSSRAESVCVLIQAVLPAGLGLANPAIAAFRGHCNAGHWRAVRAFVDVSLLVNSLDRQCSLEIANEIPNVKKRKSTIQRIEDGEVKQPRPFFW